MRRDMVSSQVNCESDDRRVDLYERANSGVGRLGVIGWVGRWGTVKSAAVRCAALGLVVERRAQLRDPCCAFLAVSF
jgi:hypothetical protein